MKEKKIGKTLVRKLIAERIRYQKEYLKQFPKDDLQIVEIKGAIRELNFLKNIFKGGR